MGAPGDVPEPRRRRGPTTSLPRHPWRPRWPEPAPPELLESGPPTQDPFRRSAQRWMRAYPRRWRRARGEELLGVLEDLAAPGAARLDVRSGLDLLRAGLATRWRTRPPFWRWLLYRALDVRLPPEHRAWALDDIDGATYGLRSWLGSVWWFVAILAVVFPAALSGDTWVVLVAVGALAATNTAQRARQRR